MPRAHSCVHIHRLPFLNPQGSGALSVFDMQAETLVSTGTYKTTGGLMVVGAVPLERGAGVLILERAWTQNAGNTIRLKHLSESSLNPGGGGGGCLKARHCTVETRHRN